jgi:hypothetical protein
MDSYDRMERDMDAEAKENVFKRRLFKGFIAAVALVMVVMVVMYMLGDYEFMDIVKGLIASDTVSEDLTVLYKDYTVFFSPEAYESVQKLYMGNLQHEFAACLRGTYDEKKYNITSVKVPDIFSQSVFNVVSGACDDTTIIRLHSHPLKRCVFSPQDIYSYQQLREQKGDLMFGLMCEPDRFTFYREG